MPNAFVKAFERHASMMVGEVLCVTVLGLPCEVGSGESQNSVHDKVVGKSNRNEAVRVSQWLQMGKA